MGRTLLICVSTWQRILAAIKKLHAKKLGKKEMAGRAVA
jgi:hypothetical protein